MCAKMIYGGHMTRTLPYQIRTSFLGDRITRGSTHIIYHGNNDYRTNRVLDIPPSNPPSRVVYHRQSVMGKILSKRILKIQNKILMKKHFENTKENTF